MIKEKSLKELDKSQVSLTITLDEKEIEKAYKETLKKYLPKLEMPGFRKGHVPESVAERKFGKTIREESTFNLMEKELQETIQTLDEKDRPLPYSTPVLQDEESLLPFKENSDITYTCIYDVYPKFKLPKYTGLDFKTTEVEVKKEDINSEIDKLREQNSMIIETDKSIEKGDVVKLSVKYTLDGKDEEGDDFFEVGRDKSSFLLSDDVIGMKKDETKKIEKTYKEDDDTNSSLKGKTVTLEVTVESARRKELPEVDDEFAEDVSEEYKSVSDLEKGIKTNLEKKAKELTENEKGNKILEKLEKETEIIIPESMMNTHLESSFNSMARNYGMTSEQLRNIFNSQGTDISTLMDAWKEPAEKELKRQLILEAIKNDMKIEVSEDEVMEKYNSTLSTITDEKIKESYINMYKDEEAFKKTLPTLIEKNNFSSDKKLSISEYEKEKQKEAEVEE